MNILGWVGDLLMMPIDWTANKVLVFAVTAPYDQLYMAMGFAAIAALLIIFTMVPKKKKAVYFVAHPVVIEDIDEEEAREILIRAQAI